MIQRPRLLRSSLTGRVYIVTAYTEGNHGMILATEKYDVSTAFNDLRKVVNSLDAGNDNELYLGDKEVPDGE